ncbi:MAG TPA: hypothetical protein VHG72_04575 [Polyangia bacterium]|nr:hypothetical protein [Polyangia bacterium]
MANRTPTRTTRMILALTLAGPTLVATARAETVELVDKTKLNAKVIHYYDGVYTLDTNGQTIKVPKEKIKAITFQLPPARAEFSTPEKTFERWRKALADGATERAVDCYALVDQGMMAAQMGLGQMSDGINKMRKEIEGTKFQVKGSKIKGDTATLTVLRQKGDESDTGEVAFVRENGEWKLFMPMNDPAAR